MVRISSSLAILSACALPLAHANPLSALYSGTDAVARFGLRKVLRLNETQIDRVLRTETTPLDPHPYAGASALCHLAEPATDADRGRDLRARVGYPGAVDSHPAFPVDLTDDNFETVLATGTMDNPFAPALPEEDVWVITVFGPDPSVCSAEVPPSCPAVRTERST